MRRRPRSWLAALAIVLCGAKASSRIELVVSAPGYPGNNEQAQPTMDAFAQEVEHKAGWKKGRLQAAYYESVTGGTDALASDAAAVALVPLSFLVQYGTKLELQPRLLAVPKTGPTETWALVAGKGKVTTDEHSLVGWEIASRAGYAPGFVRDVVFDDWSLPDGVTISFTPRILSALRRAAGGERVAVLLDGEQRAALDSLPFAQDLEVVYESDPLPAFLACTVGARLSEHEADELFAALLDLQAQEGGAAVLEQIRLVRFETLTPTQIDGIRGLRERAADPDS
jgi:hypothetical protein